MCIRDRLEEIIQKYYDNWEEQARQLLSAFRWGEQFFVLNKEPLEAYRNAKSSAELVDLQFEFFDIERPE